MINYLLNDLEIFLYYIFILIFLIFVFIFNNYYKINDILNRIFKK